MTGQSWLHDETQRIMQLVTIRHPTQFEPLYQTIDKSTFLSAKIKGITAPEIRASQQSIIREAISRSLSKEGENSLNSENIGDICQIIDYELVLMHKELKDRENAPVAQYANPPKTRGIS